MKASEIYREAARMAETEGGEHLTAWWALEAMAKLRAETSCYNHITQCEELSDVFGDQYFDFSKEFNNEECATALCFMAAIVESE